MTYQKDVGNSGEQFAVDYLLQKGYRLLARNFNVRYGEIDIVAAYGNEVVFVEVKTRTSKAFGLPEDNVTPAKMKKLVNAALIWLEEHPCSSDNWRIDVIAIILSPERKLVDLEHFINAFQ